MSNDLYELQRLTPKEKTALGLIAKSDIAVKVMHDVDQEILEARRRDCAELAAIPLRFRKKHEAAALVAFQARRNYETAEANFKAAKIAFDAAQLVAGCTANEEQGARCMLEARLIQTCDERIWDYCRFIDQQLAIVRHALAIVNYPWRDVLGREQKNLVDNSAEITAGCEAIRQADAELRAMRLQPQTRAEITAQLTAIGKRLDPFLKPFEMSPPVVTDDEVKAPPRFRFREEDVRQK